MLSPLPENPLEFTEWPWAKIEPHYQRLLSESLTENNIADWLAGWSRLEELMSETYQRLWTATTIDTTDIGAEDRYKRFLDEIYPRWQSTSVQLKTKLLDSRLQPQGMQRPLMNLRAEAEIFCEENVALLAEEQKLSIEYDRIIGAQTVEWEGQELTLLQLERVLMDVNRDKRERAWRLKSQRQLADRAAINTLWKRFLEVRTQIAANAGFANYRDYCWKYLWRFDYTPQDCQRFHRAVEAAAVPAAERLYERRRRKLGLQTLRPWDLNVNPDGLAPLRPFEQIGDLESGVSAIFHKVDPQLGEYFDIMRQEGLLDLGNRKGKAPGGYCTEFGATQRPFIFMNAVGIQDDVQTLLHEGGHAFHVFEAAALPYTQQRHAGLEFLEVASMGMELLASPYLEASQGGFYSPQEAARARVEFLETAITFWPYMALVDGFQHWVYENPSAASKPANCDACWDDLWQRFMRGIDWSDLDEERVTGWQRKAHIHQNPFYYIEYGLAQLGAFQVWRNARRDQAAAVKAYRQALALGGTASLPELYAAAGARFAFDADTLHEVVSLVESVMTQLEASYA